MSITDLGQQLTARNQVFLLCHINLNLILPHFLKPALLMTHACIPGYWFYNGLRNLKTPGKSSMLKRSMIPAGKVSRAPMTRNP